MILTCPSCDTRYSVDPASLMPSGRKVRCTNCTHIWTEYPPDDMPKSIDRALAASSDEVDTSAPETVTPEETQREPVSGGPEEDVDDDFEVPSIEDMTVEATSNLESLIRLPKLLLKVNALVGWSRSNLESLIRLPRRLLKVNALVGWSRSNLESLIRLPRRLLKVNALVGWSSLAVFFLVLIFAVGFTYYNERNQRCPADTTVLWDNCFGTLINTNGEKYVGEWKGDLRHGQGTYNWPTGAKYIGEWKDGLRHGQGTHTWPNGNKYVGEWQEDERNGVGTFVDTNGEVIHEGLWLNDRAVNRE